MFIEVDTMRMNFSDISEGKKKAVIDFFINEKNNTIPAIALAFNLSEHFVNKIINEYLSSLKKNSNK